MELLPERFRKGGFDFRLVERQGDLALFVKSKANWTHPSFEVVVVQKLPARNNRRYLRRKITANESQK